MTSEDIAAARAVIAAASPGPWLISSNVSKQGRTIFYVNSGKRRGLRVCMLWHGTHLENFNFMAAARTGWPEALGEYEAAEQHNKILQEQITKLRAVAEAAERYHSHSFPGSSCNNDCELGMALKAWRGEK